MSGIARIDISHHRLPLDPPFAAAWDPQPRTHFLATVVQVRDDAGNVGIGSGDAMHGFAGNERWFIGQDPLDLERHATVLGNLDFHGGRPWPLDTALWDLAGQIRGEPVWHMLAGAGAGGAGRASDRQGAARPWGPGAQPPQHDGAVSDRVRAYASSGVHRPAAEMAALARKVRDLGFAALKVRFGRTSLDDDVAALRAVREAIGDDIELMVDCNQGWRMPWDTRPAWTLDHATAVAERIAGARLAWIEEPLHRGDFSGLAELRRRVDVPIAGGEMTREPYEFDELLRQECLDVFQPDCVCTQGITGLRRLAAKVHEAGKVFTPHTWGNGIGLIANAHLTVGTGGAPFLEYPFDPPEWTPARRDFMLTETVEIEGPGMIRLSDRPGLGITLDPTALARTAVATTTLA